MMWLGLAIRAWAIAALGRAFRTTVEVVPGQAVVSSGPYLWVRHPSYSRLLLIVTGCGLGTGNWFALAICAVLPLPALLWRIHVEGAELTARPGRPLPRVPGEHQASHPWLLVIDRLHPRPALPAYRFA
jgi:protein-S-isoprenylcysteine O-methyltransferase Ste14